MRPLRLSTLLVVTNVGLLLLAVAGMVAVAAGLLERLADEQALARVAQAGATARQEIARTSETTLANARLLAERPTLQLLLRQGNRAELAPFLARFQDTSQLDGCVVLSGGRVVVASGAA